MQSQLRQILLLYIVAGFVFSLITWVLPFYTLIERTLLFAAFVIVPLAWVRVVRTYAYEEKLLVYLLPVGSILLAISFSMEPGTLAGISAIPWGVVTALVAWRGLHQLFQATSLPGAARATGFLYLSIGGVWTIGHQFLLPLLGFEGKIMLLTANHFHYAGLVVPVLFSEIYEYRGSSMGGKVMLVSSMIAPILVAIGITYSPLLEWMAVSILAVVMIIYSILIFKDVFRNGEKVSNVSHEMSAAVVPITMILALLYGFGEWIGMPLISIENMILFHGVGNAVLFSFLGLLGWQRIEEEKRLQHVPFSSVQGRGKIGANIFHRESITDDKSSPQGLVDGMNEYRNPSFEPSLLPESIIDFYERTDEYEMLLTPYWKKGFRFPAVLYKFVAAKVEQMNFPLKEERDHTLVESRILPMKDEKDGRSRVRAWVRTYRKTGKAIYAALYSTHVSAGTRYMNIAFPLPFSQMTSILRLDNQEGGSLSLTSWQKGDKEGQGVYLVRNGKAQKLPINETITVWEDEKEEVLARHEMWVFGMKFLILDYHIFKSN